jgi:hypothetical protein
MEIHLGQIGEYEIRLAARLALRDSRLGLRRSGRRGREHDDGRCGQNTQSNAPAGDAGRMKKT